MAEGNGGRGVVRLKLRGGCARGACVDGVVGCAGLDSGRAGLPGVLGAGWGRRDGVTKGRG